MFKFLLQEELQRLIRAAKNGNVEDLHYLIEKKKYSVETRDTDDFFVSQ